MWQVYAVNEIKLREKLENLNSIIFLTVLYCCAFYTNNFLSMDLVSNISEWLQVQCFFESNLKNQVSLESEFHLSSLSSIKDTYSLPFKHIILVLSLK